jgi:RimJ/RimL family protein N-acetyltransferase
VLQSVEGTFKTKDGRSGLVRHAKASDARPVLAIVREATMMRPRTILTTTGEVWTPRKWRHNMLGLGDRGASLVAEVAGEVAGIAGVLRGDRPAVRHVAELGITIGSTHRGIGVGRALMGGIERWARLAGMAKLVLGVFDANVEARGLYEKLGYAIEGIERDAVRFPEATFDLVKMAKTLD